MQNFQVSSNKYIMEVSLKQQKYRNTSWNFLSDVWNPNCFYKQHHCEELWFGDDGEEVSICEQAANAPANDDCNGLKGEWQTRSRLPHWFDWTEMNMNWQEGKKQRMERKKEKPVRCLNSELDCNQHFSNWLPWTTEKKAFGYLQSPLMLSSQQPPCLSWQTVLCSWAMTMDDHRHDWGGVGGLIGHFKSHSSLQKIT